MSSKRSRSYCFTVQVQLASNQASDYSEYLGTLLSDSTYSIYQLEKAPTTGKAHLQGYVHYKNPRSFAAVKKLCPSAHLEIAKGSAQDNRKYCSKAESQLLGPWESGELPKPGRRSDMYPKYTKIEFFTFIFFI
jgi:hypothetical protein